GQNAFRMSACLMAAVHICHLTGVAAREPLREAFEVVRWLGRSDTEQIEADVACLGLESFFESWHSVILERPPDWTEERGAFMLDGFEVASALAAAGATDVVWIPDSELGLWEAGLMKHLRLLRVCREGEAMALAAGLLLGGRKPIVLIQCTGLFEAGDS